MTELTQAKPTRPRKEIPPGRLVLTVAEIVHLTGYSRRMIDSFFADGTLKNVSIDRYKRARRGDVLRVLVDGRR